MYKDGKETTHVKVGKRKTYIKDMHNVCKHGHKTGVQEQGSKHSS